MFKKDGVHSCAIMVHIGYSYVFLINVIPN